MANPSVDAIHLRDELQREFWERARPGLQATTDRIQARHAVAAIERMYQPELRLSQSFPAPILAGSEFDSPLFASILEMRCEAVERSIYASEKLREGLPARPLFGTLAAGSARGMALEVPVGNSREFLVLVDQGMFVFSWLLSKIVALALPVQTLPGGLVRFEPVQSIRGWLKENPPRQNSFAEATTRLRDLIDSYHLHGDFTLTAPFLISRPELDMAIRLNDAMETFVVAHEYAHIVSGHLTDSPTADDERAAGDPSRILGWFRARELAADGSALLITLRALDGTDPATLATTYAGIDLYFSVLNWLEIFAPAIMATGPLPAAGERARQLEEQYSKYPPPIVRRELLRVMISRRPDSGYIVPVAKRVEEAVQLMINVAFPAMREAYPIFPWPENV